MATLHRQGLYCVKLILCVWGGVAGTKEAQEGVGSPGTVVTVVNEPMLGLGTELGPFKRATNSLKH